MTACLVVLGLLVGCGDETDAATRLHATAARPTPPPAPDPWIAEDKLQHFAASFAATSMAYGGARSLLDPAPARIAAGSVALTLGVLKEIADRRGGGPFSLKDLAWDAAGIALGLTLAHSIR